MNTSIPIQAPVGTPPAFPNFYVLSWSLINAAILIALAVFIFRYLQQRNDYRKQVLNKLDTLISLVQQEKKENEVGHAKNTH